MDTKLRRSALYGRWSLVLYALLFSTLCNAECLANNKPGCAMVGDINPNTPSTYEAKYAAYADLVWGDFIAINLPASKDAGGKYVASASTVDGLNYNAGEYTSVWQVWAQARDIFQPNGIKPAPFASGHQTPAFCMRAGANGIELTQRLVLDEYIQANRMGPVIDKKGDYVRFGLHFNETIFNYIRDRELFSVEGQSTFDKNNPNRSKGVVQFPPGKYTTATPKESDSGSVFVKSSWKILSEDEEKSHQFFRTKAYIFDEAGGAFNDEPTVAQKCEEKTIGLVGLHIVHLTNSAPQWVWATFEHVSNAPWAADFAHGNPTGEYSFFDPKSCKLKDGKPACGLDELQLPAQPWNPQRTGQKGTQVVRMAAPGKGAIESNIKFKNRIQAAYGDTVWKNYFLVDVQFPTVNTLTDAPTGKYVENKAYPEGAPTPTFLANSTMETYIPGFGHGQSTSVGVPVPISDQMQNQEVKNGKKVDPFALNVYSISGGADRVTSSCIGCHADASMTTGSNAHFVFSMSRAQHVKAPAAASLSSLGSADIEMVHSHLSHVRNSLPP